MNNVFITAFICMTITATAWMVYDLARRSIAASEAEAKARAARAAAGSGAKRKPAAKAGTRPKAGIREMPGKTCFEIVPRGQGRTAARIPAAAPETGKAKSLGNGTIKGYYIGRSGVQAVTGRSTGT